MTVVQTLLVFVGIPLAIIVLIFLGTYGSSLVRQPNRYRPGKPWTFGPSWYVPHPDAVARDTGQRQIESGSSSTTAVEVPAVSGDLAKAVNPTELQYGPQGSAHEDGPFTATQLARLDEALTLSSRETGLTFSVYVGELQAPPRAHAEALFERLTDNSVLLAVSPGQRIAHIVTGPGSSNRLPNRSCALAALAMRAAFANGDLVGGIVTGLRMLSDSAGGAR